MAKRQSLTGRVFGKLTVHEKVGVSTHGCYLWRCTCSCGTSDNPSEVTVPTSSLTSGNTQSCNCKRYETARANAKWGGLSDGPEYEAWLNAKNRCADEEHSEWHNYGLRGIRMCAEWEGDFLAFYHHIGPRPSSEHSLDRIDNDSHYEPGNVRWADEETQQGNRRACTQLSHDGRTLTPAGWARILGVTKTSMYARIKKKLPPDELFRVGRKSMKGVPKPRKVKALAVKPRCLNCSSLTPVSS